MPKAVKWVNSQESCQRDKKKYRLSQLQGSPLRICCHSLTLLVRFQDTDGPPVGFAEERFSINYAALVGMQYASSNYSRESIIVPIWPWAPFILC